MAAATTTTPSTTSERPDDGSGGESSPQPERRYRPVVIVHGLMTGDVSTMEHLAARITELHPGTRTYVIDRFCGLASLEPLWRQTKQLGLDLLQICSLHPEGVHVIGYSQGGLIARGMIEDFGVEHNVKTFVSLSSPQGGQFGAECFTKMFPALTARTAYEVFYTRLGQHSLSVANYWYDPRHRDLYLEYSAYLAVIDNLKMWSNVANGDDDNRRRPEWKDDDDDDDAVSSTTTAALPSKTYGDGVGSSSGGSASAEPIVYRTADSASSSSGTSLEVRIAVAIAKVSAATVKVAEGHGADDDHSDVDSVSIAVDTTTADFSDDEVENPMPIPNWGAVDSNSCGFSSDDSDGRFNAKVRKLGLTRLQRLVLIGGPDDGVISPWQSSQFGVLDSAGGLIPMRERRQNDVYSDDDVIGLRQLDDTGRLIEYTVPGVGHHEWHRNEKVLQECIINWLD